jgi:phosphoribosylaminoimidazole-succinocarboxamide synthase
MSPQRKDGEFIRHGSAKNIYRADETSLLFECTRDFSVFDVGKARDQIPGKDQAICACAVQSFTIAESIGVPTHFIEQVDAVTIRIREAQIITDRPLTPRDENFVVPAEFIYRLFVAGSIDRDFRSGAKKPEKYGLPSGIIPRTGTPFPYPVHMFTTKFEKIDRDLGIEELCQMAGLTLQDLEQFWSMIDRTTGAISLKLAQGGFANLDGKLECLMGPGRIKAIGDVFGTPDEDRPVPIDLLKKGKVKHHSKEFLREHFISTGYYDQLKAARNAKPPLPDPPIPRLPEEVIAETASRYAAVTKAYTGVTISY